ncbi:MAG: hypothetical protein Q9191_003118 [Dirinaria sp. TL-2023a]
MEAPSIPVSGVAAQETFPHRFNLDDPIAAMTSYSEQMRRFTQQQMEIATKSHRRSPSTGVSAAGSLSSESSVDSTNTVESVASQS